MPALFGEKLAHLRQQQKISQTALARQLGLATPAHISHLESGRKAPSLKLVLRLAAALNVSTDYLLRDTIPTEASDQHRTATPVQETRFPALFGIKVRSLREQRRMKQIDLAQQLGLRTQAHISLLENGNSEASIAIVVQLADLFGVTTDYLLRDSIPLQATGAM